MLQIIVSVGCAVNGSISAVSGCGTTSRSASLIARQPTTLEPSKPIPSSNVSSVSASAGIAKCCQTPGKSMNRRSTVVTSRWRIRAKTSFGVTAMRSFPCQNRAGPPGFDPPSACLISS